jgi:pyrroline-5-carboxylate reductase
MDTTIHLGFIGAGNMARALVGGLVLTGLPASQIYVYDARAEALLALAQSHGIAPLSPDTPALDVVIIAVKPVDVQKAIADARQWIGANTLVVSIAAGIPTHALLNWLPPHTALIRAMPNTPALIRAGITALFATSQVSARQKQMADDVLRAAGEVLWVEEEQALDAVTAVSGSGPAYVFYLIEALESAAIEEGLPAELSRRLALATFAGASRLALESSEPPAVLREQVTSKGGTTQAALESLAEDKVAGSLKKAVAKARLRAKEMGKAYGGA